MEKVDFKEFPEWAVLAAQKALDGTLVKPLNGTAPETYEIVFAMVACAHVRQVPNSPINIDSFCGQVPALESLAHNAALALSLWISQRSP